MSLMFFRLFLFTSIALISLEPVFAGRFACNPFFGFYPAWTHWSECSQTCGDEGKRFRECKCFDDNDVADGRDGDGEGGCNENAVRLEIYDDEPCNREACPDDDDELEAVFAILTIILISPYLKGFTG